MAVFNNVTVLGDIWVDINTISGVPVGTAFIIQNISSAKVILKESSTTPTNDNGPVLYDSSFGDLSQASVKLNSTTMWAKVVGTPSKAILAIYN